MQEGNSGSVMVERFRVWLINKNYHSVSLSLQTMSSMLSNNCMQFISAYFKIEIKCVSAHINYLLNVSVASSCMS